MWTYDVPRNGRTNVNGEFGDEAGDEKKPKRLIF